MADVEKYALHDRDGDHIYDVYRVDGVEVRVLRGTPIEFITLPVAEAVEGPPRPASAGVWHIPASLCEPGYTGGQVPVSDPSGGEQPLMVTIVVDQDR